MIKIARLEAVRKSGSIGADLAYMIDNQCILHPDADLDMLIRKTLAEVERLARFILEEQNI